MSIFVPAIEKFWFAAKTHFNKRLLAATSEISRDRFRALVLESVNSVAQAKVLRLCEANREYVSRVLQSQAQQNQANEAQWALWRSSRRPSSDTTFSNYGLKSFKFSQI